MHGKPPYLSSATSPQNMGHDDLSRCQRVGVGRACTTAEKIQEAVNLALRTMEPARARRTPRMSFPRCSMRKLPQCVTVGVKTVSSVFFVFLPHAAVLTRENFSGSVPRHLFSLSPIFGFTLLQERFDPLHCIRFHHVLGHDFGCEAVGVTAREFLLRVEE